MREPVRTPRQSGAIWPIHRGRGFTVIELTIVLAVIAVLAGVAVPALQRATYEAEVSGTARSLSSAINLHAALANRADIEACGRVAYPYGQGAVCVQGDEPGGSPVEPVGFTGYGSRNSEKLWRVFLDNRPIETNPDNLDGSGWVATTASDCDRDTTYTYCWDYYTSPDKRAGTIRYNNANQAGIEVIMRDG